MDRPELEETRYQLLQQIGRGANATVWRTLDQQSGRLVALKVLRLEVMDLDEIQRLDQEVRILNSLRHPGIVEVLGRGEAADGRPYLVMEWISGGSLRQLLVKQPVLSPRQVSAVVAQICDALVEAHKAGVVHRDIKPENVLLCSQRPLVLKLADFGTAKRLSPEAPVITLDGRILGTPHYLAPERARGRPVGGAADVYAVAVMAYEMLAGHAPFDGPSPLQIVTQQVTAPPPPLPGVAPAVEQVVLAGMCKDPRERPSAEVFSAQLCRAVRA